MTDMDRPPERDHGPDQRGYVELQDAPEGIEPPAAAIDNLLATACLDCHPNIFLRYVGSTTQPSGEWRCWQPTIAHDEGCPMLARIEQTTHFYGDDCVRGHNRCQGYATEPGVIYHAHDLPRCPNQGKELIDNRWLCSTHAAQRRS